MHTYQCGTPHDQQALSPSVDAIYRVNYLQQRHFVCLLRRPGICSARVPLQIWTLSRHWQDSPALQTAICRYLVRIKRRRTGSAYRGLHRSGLHDVPQTAFFALFWSAYIPDCSNPPIAVCILPASAADRPCWDRPPLICVPSPPPIRSSPKHF